jgi:hypothetical protein
MLSHAVLCCADRLSLSLPGRQPDLIKALGRRAPGLPLVVVLMHGGGLDVGWLQGLPSVKALLSVPFPGQVRCSRVENTFINLSLEMHLHLLMRGVGVLVWLSALHPGRRAASNL